MQIKIKNYRGIGAAEIELSPIALVAGTNGAGKTSIAQAVAAALTRNAAIVEGVTKAAAGLLLRDGAKRGQCAIAGPGGTAAANWPGASISVDGDAPPHASAIACGLDCIAEMKPKDAAAALQAALRADPAREQLREALVQAGARPELADAVAAKTDAEGYDAAYKRAQGRATELKGQWELITGERWGAAKAEGWQAGAAPADADLEALSAAAVAADQALEQAVADQAVDAAHVERLRETVRDSSDVMATFKVSPSAKERGLEKLEKARDDARAKAEAAVAAYAALPSAETTEETVPCPHCGAHVVIRGRTLVEPSGGPDEAENAARVEAKTQANIEIARTRKAAEEADRASADAHRAVQERARALAALDDLKTGGTSAEDVARARQAVQDAHAAVRAIETTVAATDKHRAIVEMLAVADVLAPTGIRQTALETAMVALHEDMRALSEAAHWAEIAIGEDLAVTYGGRPYRLLSASEQFRARVVLQVALAMRDGSNAVIIDAADILDRQGRNGLFHLLADLPVPALVTMTMNQREDVPVLGRLGKSYWIDDDAATAPLAANDNKPRTSSGDEQAGGRAE